MTVLKLHRILSKLEYKQLAPDYPWPICPVCFGASGKIPPETPDQWWDCKNCFGRGRIQSE